MPQAHLPRSPPRRLTPHPYAKEITMEYTRLGNTGLRVSRLALGCMSYGDNTSAGAHRWGLDDDAAQPFFRQAVEAGITFWDTANVYQHGTSEELVSRAIKRYSRREDIVMATKVFGKMHGGPGGQGLSRKAIFEQADASLTRLGTGYVDQCRAVRQTRRPAAAWCRPLPGRTGTSEQTWSKHDRGRSWDRCAPVAPSELDRRPRARGKQRVRSVIAAAGAHAG